MLGTLAVLLLLAGTEGESPAGDAGIDPPATIVSAWADATRAVDIVGQCDETSRRIGLEKRYTAITRRYYAALLRARGIWGNTVADGVDYAMLTAQPVVCRRASILQAMDRADRALDNEDRAFAEATVRMTSGAWVGPLMLCRDTVAGAERGFEALAGRPMVLVKLRPGVAAIFGAITGRSIETALAVRLDGEIISEPMVFERIDGGWFQVSGPEWPVLERFKNAVGRPC
jgi:hypothetical protein